MMCSWASECDPLLCGTLFLQLVLFYIIFLILWQDGKKWSWRPNNASTRSRSRYSYCPYIIVTAHIIKTERRNKKQKQKQEARIDRSSSCVAPPHSTNLLVYCIRPASHFSACIRACSYTPCFLTVWVYISSLVRHKWHLYPPPPPPSTLFPVQCASRNKFIWRSIWSVNQISRKLCSHTCLG